MDMVYVRWDVVVAVVLTGFNLLCLGQAQCSPSNVVVSSITSTQVGISWECYDPLQSSKFNVTYTLINKDKCDTEDALLNKPQTVDCMCCDCILSDSFIFSYWHELSGLSPYSTYKYSVEPRDGSNTGRKHVGTFITAGGVPTAAPFDVKVTSTDLDSLSFSWDEVPCGSRHGEITSYAYLLIDENNNTVADGATSDRQITINNGLMQCRTYKFRVGAVGIENTIGPYSESFTAMTSTPVTNLNAVPASSTELDISWEAPTELCTANVEYYVEYRLTNRGQCQPLDDNTIIIESVPGMTVTLSSLHPYSTYELQVRASGGIASVAALTSEAAPTDTPTNIAIKNKTHTSLTLTWNEPRCTHRNGNITYYTYSFKLTESTSYIVQEQVTSDTEVTFAGLSTSTEHTFSVSANTVIGGGPVASLEATTLNAGTVTLLGIRISAGSQSGSVVIAWEVPDASLSDVTFYDIRYWKDDEVDNVVNQQIKANDAITMYTINGLELGSNYHFQINAENTAGTGSWSEVYVFTVASDSGPNTGVIVGSSIAAIVVLFVVAVFIGYRLKMSNTNKSRPETGDVQNTEFGMASRSHSNKHNQAQQHTTSRGNDDDGYDNPDPHEPGRPTSGYYEDLDKTTMNKDQEYQSIDNIENRPRGYQNIAMSWDEDHTQATYDADYEIPEPDEGDKQSGNYEGLARTGMEKDHEYQALGEGNTQSRPYQNVNIK